MCLSSGTAPADPPTDTVEQREKAAQDQKRANQQAAARAKNQLSNVRTGFLGVSDEDQISTVPTEKVDTTVKL